MTFASAKVSMKLLIDTKSKRVLFAEADKDCVDFLFHILSLPVGTVIRLLQGQETVGCLPNLYESFKNLDESYLQPGQNKNSILKPLLPANHASGSVPNLLLITDDKATERLFYRCSNCPFNALYNDPKTCPNCLRTMTKTMKYTAPAVAKGVDEGGFVKGMVTYMVMDDLEVKPMSTISGITLLNKLNVKELGSLQEKVVSLGTNEAVKLLKMSLQSKNVLTKVFLKTGKRARVN
ncbi:uncharacterized protein LOC142529374 [Primulina tabacum]|uniref:uncharacterized protein LOC142529374 n=1 Tax=Primulina tabacum TaxID=48773 RepID=UPI003F59D7FB